MKLEDAAATIDINPSTLSRIETGKAPVKTAYLAPMFTMYNVADPEAQRVLIDMAREGHRKGWWADYDDVLPSGFHIYVGLEAEASSLRSYESNLVHGLLQTTAYAEAVLRELQPRATDEQILRLVDLRLQRQRLLEHIPPLDLWVIMEEGAIRRHVGGAMAMRHQLEHLIQASRWPNVTLQVMAFQSGAHAGMAGPFSILEFPERSDPRVAFTESLGGFVYTEKEKDVATRIDAFDRMRASALSTAASVDLIKTAADSIN